ncbi:MAG: nucleoside-diphosphate sugar epimerase/dehydratase [Pseudomonadota bacterium]
MSAILRFADRTTDRLLSLPRPAKRLVAVSSDLLLVIATVWLAFVLRLEDFVPLSYPVLTAAATSAVIAVPVFLYFGLYNAIFRFAGTHALIEVGRAILVYAIVFSGIFTLIGFSGIPRSVGIIQPILFLLGVLASRAFVRGFLGRRSVVLPRKARMRVLIYGAGSAGQQLANALAGGEGYEVLGFIDDDPSLHKRRLNGRLVYAPDRLYKVIGKLDITDILLAIPSTDRIRRREILRFLEPMSVRVRTLPGLDDLAYGRIQASELKELDADDLLGRQPVEPDRNLIESDIRGKNVLVTGAGGSIGSELCRQIIACQPMRLVLFDSSEFALFRIHQELLPRAARTGIDLVPVLGSVQDEERIDEVISSFGLNTVYHAAAYKHVPLVQGNPIEGLKNNVWGTIACARAAHRHGVGKFVLVSTDKAVRPTNVMGASKRLAELVLQAIDADLRSAPGSQDADGLRTRFSMVRFGNVLDSSGSVVPLFRKQIEDGGPITLTHPEVTRFFMTIPEAAQLVIQAGAMGQGGDVFLLDMGEPVQIAHLARRMIALSGLTAKDEENPDGDIEIRVVGLRPGEKLYEELLIGDNPQPTGHPRIMKANEEMIEWSDLSPQLDSLRDAMRRMDMETIEAMLTRLVSGYKPSSCGTSGD